MLAHHTSKENIVTLHLEKDFTQLKPYFEKITHILLRNYSCYFYLRLKSAYVILEFMS